MPKKQKSCYGMRDAITVIVGMHARREFLAADRRLVRPQGVKKYLATWGYVAFWRKTRGFDGFPECHQDANWHTGNRVVSMSGIYLL